MKHLLPNVEDPDDLKRFVNSVDSQKRVPLYWAVAKGNPRVVELLLQNGADPLKTDKNSETSIHAAAANCKKHELDSIGKKNYGFPLHSSEQGEVNVRMCETDFGLKTM